MPGNLADRPAGWPMQALHRHTQPSRVRQSRSFLALSYKPVRAQPSGRAFISLPRHGQVMQILHHADLASMAAPGGLNLVCDDPPSDRFSRSNRTIISKRPRDENLCTGRRRHRADDRMVPCRGRARRHHRRPACFHRERRQRRQWRPALLRVRGAAGVAGNPQEAAIAAAVAGFADAHPPASIRP
jgi:hypothetical protein